MKPSKNSQSPRYWNLSKYLTGFISENNIDAAIMQKQEITPRLIEILENVLADPAKYAEDEMLYDHIYAVMLLGHFKALQYGRGSP